MIGAIENAILARLKLGQAANCLGYSWRTCATYPENWDAMLKDAVAWRAPAAWVVFAGFGQARNLDGGGAEVQATFALVVAAENMRNEEATRHGGGNPAEPGSYQRVEDAAALLINQDLDLLVSPLSLVAVQPVRPPEALRERKVSMFALVLGCTVPIAAIDPDADSIDAFKVFHANWDVPAFGNVDADPARPGVQLPADLTADATDHLELQQ